MNSAKDYNSAGGLALLLIGSPKSGKTALAMTFPSPWVLDCDNNLRGALRHHQELGDPITEFYFDNPSTVEPKKRWDFSMKAIQAAIDDPKIKTIIVDGLSLLGEYLQAMILANTGRDSNSSKLVIAGEECMQMTHWTPFKNLMTRLIMAAKSSGKPFIMTCHEAPEYDKSGAVISYRPLIQGSLKNNIAGFFSDCWRTETKASLKNTGEYKVRFAPRNLFQIGNSLGIKEVDLDVTNKTKTELNKFFQPYIS